MVTITNLTAAILVVEILAGGQGYALIVPPAGQALDLENPPSALVIYLGGQSPTHVIRAITPVLGPSLALDSASVGVVQARVFMITPEPMTVESTNLVTGQPIAGQVPADSLVLCLGPLHWGDPSAVYDPGRPPWDITITVAGCSPGQVLAQGPEPYSSLAEQPAALALPGTGQSPARALLEQVALGLALVAGLGALSIIFLLWRL